MVSELESEADWLCGWQAGRSAGSASRNEPNQTAASFAIARRRVCLGSARRWSRWPGAAGRDAYPTVSRNEPNLPPAGFAFVRPRSSLGSARRAGRWPGVAGRDAYPTHCFAERTQCAICCLRFRSAARRSWLCSTRGPMVRRGRQGCLPHAVSRNEPNWS